MTRTTSLRHTPLTSCHVELGARMVDFGGWEMPIHYGSQIDEHHAVRQDAGMFDVSHMCVIDVQGDDARNFLRMVLANNVDKIQGVGKALYSCMLNPAGGILDDLIVYHESETRYRLIVNAATALRDLQWLRQQAQLQKTKVVLTPRRFGDAPSKAGALAIIAVQGPQSGARCWRALPHAQEAAHIKHFHAVYHADPRFGCVMIARTGYTGEDGYELILAAEQAPRLWNELLNAGVQPAGLGARDTLRLEAGMNLYGQDMDERTSPLDCGLGWTVDLDGSRTFVGSAALRRQKQKWQMAGLIALDRAGILRPGQPIETPAGQGEVTSGSFSPTLKRSIALARLPLSVEAPAEVHVLVRGKPVRARVVCLPFVRNGQIKV